MRKVLPRFAVGVWGALALVGCDHKEPPPAAPPVHQAGAVGVSTPVKRDKTPLTQKERGTDEGELALSNLDSQIAGQQQLFAKTKDYDAYTHLVGLFVHRGTMTGRVADYTKALQLADALVKAKPKDNLAWMVHAIATGALHRFDDARKDYAKAELFGEKPGELIGPRLGLDQATGKNDDAVFAYRKERAEQYPAVDTLGAYAVVQGDRGDVKGATASFAAAQSAYRDTGPYPLANLYFLEGLLEQRSGSQARARELFQAAHDRLPQHAQTTAHLASVLAVTGDKERGIALLEGLKDADDPEYAGLLAGIVEDTDKEKAAALRKDATTRYEALLELYPLAFADHAARFYLSTKDPAQAKRALVLAKLNLDNRATLDAQRLTVDAALAAGDTKTACMVADAITQRTYVPPEAHVTASKAYAACGQKERADKEIAAMSDPPPVADAGK